MWEGRQSKAVGAYHDTFNPGDCGILHLNPAAFFKLYDSKVLSVLLYGVEIWGPTLKWQSVLRNPLDQFRGRAWRGFLGLPRSVPTLAMLTELQRQPLMYKAVSVMTEFWNILVHSDSSTLHFKALVEDVHWFQQDDKHSWTYGLYKSLAQTSSRSQHEFLKSRIRKLRAVDISYLGDAHMMHWGSQWQRYSGINPRDPLASHRVLAAYDQYSRCEIPRAHYLFASIPWKFKHIILKWRLGATNALAVELHNLPFCARVCTQHVDPAIQDACHVLMECPVTSMFRPDSLAVHFGGIGPALSLKSWWAYALRSNLHDLGMFLMEVSRVFDLDQANGRHAAGRAL